MALKRNSYFSDGLSDETSFRILKTKGFYKINRQDLKNTANQQKPSEFSL